MKLLKKCNRFFRTCAIQISRHVGVVRTEEQPHPESKEGRRQGDGVEEVGGKEVPVGIIVHVPLGVIRRGVDVEMRCIIQRKNPVVAHLASSTVRRCIRHNCLAREEGLGVEGFASCDDAARQLEGGGVTGGHFHGHVDVALAVVFFGGRCFRVGGGSQRGVKRRSVVEGKKDKRLRQKKQINKSS